MDLAPCSMLTQPVSIELIDLRFSPLSHVADKHDRLVCRAVLTLDSCCGQTGYTHVAAKVRCFRPPTTALVMQGCHPALRLVAPSSASRGGTGTGQEVPAGPGLNPTWPGCRGLATAGAHLCVTHAPIPHALDESFGPLMGRMSPHPSPSSPHRRDRMGGGSRSARSPRFWQGMSGAAGPPRAPRSCLPRSDRRSSRPPSDFGAAPSRQRRGW